jgi:hypothetical protein
MCKIYPVRDHMHTTPNSVVRSLRSYCLLFVINAVVLTLIPLSLVCGLGKISYLRRPDLVSLIWTFILIYPCIMFLPVVRVARLWQRLGDTEKYELNGTGLDIVSTQLVTHLRYWAHLLMLVNFLYFPFLLLGIFK